MPCRLRWPRMPHGRLAGASVGLIMRVAAGGAPLIAVAMTGRRCAVATALAVLLLAACGSQPALRSTVPTTRPLASATPPGATLSGATVPLAPSSAPLSLRPPLPAGTACGTSVTSTPQLPVPGPTAPASQPVWSRAAVAGPVTSLAWSPDGTLLAATAGDPNGTARIWTAAGAPVATLRGPSAPDQCLAWSMDSQRLATASADGSVRVWDRTGRLLRVLPGTDPVFSLAWSPDDTVLATGAIHFPAPSATGPEQLPGVVRLWRADGTLLHTVGTELTGGKFLNLAWSPDGSRLAAGAIDYATWRADGTPVASLLGGGPPAWAMAWAPDDTMLAIGNESSVLVLVTATGDTVGTAGFPGDVNALSFTADGRGLLVGLPDRVQFVNVADPSHVLWSAFTAGDGRVAWSPGGRRLAIAITNGLAVLRPDGSAVAALLGCSGDPVAFAWTGPRLAAATDQGQLCVWRAPPA